MEPNSKIWILTPNIITHLEGLNMLVCSTSKLQCMLCKRWPMTQVLKFLSC